MDSFCGRRDFFPSSWREVQYFSPTTTTTTSAHARFRARASEIVAGATQKKTQKEDNGTEGWNGDVVVAWRGPSAIVALFFSAPLQPPFVCRQAIVISQKGGWKGCGLQLIFVLLSQLFTMNLRERICFNFSSRHKWIY